MTTTTTPSRDSEAAVSKSAPNYRLHLISHTHWDREWYLSHENFRLQLVDLIDHLLDILEADPDFRFFHLDGQTIVLEDYLEIRPHQRERLARFIADGRILIGPWYLQNDEFLTSGEATVRNLLIGRRICRGDYGVEPMGVGYVPDQFGNISQLPQILRGFGIPYAVYGRGCQRTGDGRAEFLWQSPDGSEVFTVFLHSWYNNAQRLPRDPRRALAMCREIIAAQEPRSRTGHFLLMNGVDHLQPQENLAAIVRDVNALEPGFQLVHASMPMVLDTVRDRLADPPVQAGEFREGDIWSVLPGTASSRVHLKMQNFSLQNELAAWIEPLAALARAGGMEYGFEDALAYAWRLLIQNHPHDSICGCSIDEVHDQMEARFRRVADVTRDLSGRVMRHLAATIAPTGRPNHSVAALFNALPEPRAAVIEATVDMLENERLRNLRLVDCGGREVAMEVLAEERVILRILNPKRLPKLLKVRRHKVLVDAPAVPATGVLGLFLERRAKPAAAVRRPARPRKLRGQAIAEAGAVLENEHLRVRFHSNGSFDIEAPQTGRVFRNQHIFEDVGDRGNEYVFLKPANDAVRTTEFLDAELEMLEQGPLRQCARVTLKWKLPPEVDDRNESRPGRPVAFTIVSTISLARGARTVAVETRVRNTVKDHRLRVRFPSGADTDTGFADAPFDIVRRPAAEGTQHPMQSFAAACDDRAGLAVFSAGMPEFEVEPAGATVCLTLLRCVDLLGDLPPQFWEREQLIEDFVPGAQCLREYAFRYGVHPFAGGTPPSEVRREAERFVNPPRLFQLPADQAAWGGERPFAPPYFDYFDDEASAIALPPATAPASRSLLEVDNPRVSLQAVKPFEPMPGNAAPPHRGCVVRMVNLSEAEERCRVTFGPAVVSVQALNLAEEPQGELAADAGNGVELTIPAKRIVTLGVRFG